MCTLRAYSYQQTSIHTFPAYVWQQIYMCTLPAYIARMNLASSRSTAGRSKLRRSRGSFFLRSVPTGRAAEFCARQRALARGGPRSLPATPHSIPPSLSPPKKDKAGAKLPSSGASRDSEKKMMCGRPALLAQRLKVRDAKAAVARSVAICRPVRIDLPVMIHRHVVTYKPAVIYPYRPVAVYMTVAAHIGLLV